MLNFLTSKLSKSKTEKGFTLVEFLIVLGLIFVLVAVIAVASYKASERANISRAKSDVMMIVSAAKSWHANHQNYADLQSIKDLCDSNLLPQKWGADGTKAYDPWDKLYEVVGNDDGTFTITINGVPTNGADQQLVNNLILATVDQKTADKDDNGVVTATFR